MSMERKTPTIVMKQVVTTDSCLGEIMFLEILEQNDDQETKENYLTEIVTPGEFLQCLDKVRSFAQSNGVFEEVQKALSDLEG